MPRQAPGGGGSAGSAAPSSGGDAKTIFEQQCGRCHKAGDVGSGRIDLSHVGGEKDQKWLEVQIRTPDQHHSRMPAFPASRLSDADLHTLVTYLASLK